jgi:hypothetical protein
MERTAINTTVSGHDHGPTPISVMVTLKWAKQVFEFEIAIPKATNSKDKNLNSIKANPDGTMRSNEGSSKFTGRSFMNVVHKLTNVPVDRQKVVVVKSKLSNNSKTKWWKGVLKQHYDFASAVAEDDDSSSLGTIYSEPIALSVTLMGTADVLAPLNKDKNNATIFLEDMTPSEQKEAERQELIVSMDNVAAMIPVLQIPPVYRQPPEDDKYKDNNNGGSGTAVSSSDYEEDRIYDRLVHGCSQLRIDAMLKNRKRTPEEPMDEEDIYGFPSPRSQLMGRVVMTMGLELQRAYINDLAVLNQDGTLVSGLDDGHVHMWKHCQKVNDLFHESAGGIGIFDAFPGVDSVIALDHDKRSPAAFATAGRGVIRVWDDEGEPLLGRSSPLPYTSPTGLVRIPVGSSKNNILCLAARFRVARPPSRRPRLVPQDNAGRRRVREIEYSEAMVNEDLTKLSKSVQVLYFDAASGSTATSGSTSPTNRNATFGNDDGNANANAKPSLRSFFLDMPNPVTALASWKDGNTDMLVVGDDRGGITFWKIALATSLTPSAMRSSHSAALLHGTRSTGIDPNNNNNDPKLACTKIKYLKIASIEDPTESRCAIACLKYAEETKQLFISTKEIPPTPISSSQSDDSSSRECPTTIFPLKPPQAVHCISVDAILNSNHNHHDPLDFTLDGHKDVVTSILPLPNGDLVTSGGKMDATTQVWSRSQLRGAASRIRELDYTNGANYGVAFLDSSPPPPILTEASTIDLCGYVFATELLEDFKGKDDSGGKGGKGDNPFGIAVARYNVVKIVI